MSTLVRKVYHRLPAGPIRSVAASVRGMYLRLWRYGRETERLVEEALERETWNSDHWRRWQEERLEELLHRAATTVPYYRTYWSTRRRRGDRASWGLLENWPLLSKETVRRHPRALLADDCRTWTMFHEHTSGTTGTPLDLWWSRTTVRAWYALAEARWRRWYGVNRHDRWAILGGQQVVPPTQDRPPFWVWNSAMRQLYLSTYHLAPHMVPAYIQALRTYRVRYVYGYTSALHALAHAARGGLNSGDLTVAITNAEPLLPHQRAQIERTLQCPVRETYSMAEIVAAAGECEHGALHLWPEVGWLEYFNGETRAGPGEPGDLVCTGLLNQDMPLIRYQVGDRAVPATDGSTCACGRSLPRLARIEGRTDDLVYTADGRAVSHLHLVFNADLHVAEGQIVQEAPDVIRVRYVPAEGHGASDERLLVDGVRARMGKVKVLLEPVSAIQRTATGKLRTVICQLPPELRQGPER